MDSTQMHTNPEQVRRFAADLGRFADRLGALDQRMACELSRLGDTFRDEGFDEFRAHFHRSQQDLRRFVDEVQNVIPNLQADASAAEAYQRVRLNP